MTLMWMGLLVIILIGALHNALQLRYDGVGDFYSVTLKKLSAGRITFQFSCSNDNKNFLLSLVLNNLEQSSEIEVEYLAVPNTVMLGVYPGKDFHLETVMQLNAAIDLHGENREMEERLLIVHDLLQLVYEPSSMRITERDNFHVDYNVELKLQLLGKTL
ncbi:hypothetical protein [Vibrio phage phiKT1028]|nr:hypothetical protein [Vibrio phage phiKT1028]